MVGVEILNKIKNGSVFTFDTPLVTTIKQSPPEDISLVYEHQYGEKYVFRNEDQNKYYFSLIRNSGYIDCKWIIEKGTMILCSVYVVYDPGEYVLKLC
jgi:hypothetical protein